MNVNKPISADTTFKKLKLSNRFLIMEKLSSGQFGQIFKAKDQK